jgi:hypothetical protein
MDTLCPDSIELFAARKVSNVQPASLPSWQIELACVYHASSRSIMSILGQHRLSEERKPFIHTPVASIASLSEH